MEIEADKALLFSKDEFIVWGELELEYVDPTLNMEEQELSCDNLIEDGEGLTYLYVVNDVEFNFPEVSLSMEPHDSIESLEAASRENSITRIAKFAYFSEGKKVIDCGKDTIEGLKVEITAVLLVWYSIIAIVFIILGTLAAKDRSKKITGGIVSLYETLREIQIRLDADSRQTELSYKPQSREINALNKKFNEIVKTSLISKTDLREEEGKSLLNYAEAINIFHNFRDERHVGICYANQGALYILNNEFKPAEESFSYALEKAEIVKTEERSQGD